MGGCSSCEAFGGNQQAQEGNITDKATLETLAEDPLAEAFKAKKAKYLEDHGQVNEIHVAVLENELADLEGQHGEGVDIDAVTGKGMTAVMLAARYGKDDAMRTLLRLKAKVDLIDGERNTAVMIAAKAFNPECLSMLLDGMADISKKNSEGLTPLHFASRCQIPKCTELLCDGKADVNAVNGDSWTALHFATLAGAAHCVYTLLLKNANIEEKAKPAPPLHAPPCGTPLMIAASEGMGALTRQLLDSKAGVDTQVDNKTALDMACTRDDNSEVIAALVAAGAGVKRKLPDGTTPLHICCTTQNADGVEKIIMAKASLEEVRKDDACTPLLLCAQYGNADMTGKLLQCKANIKAKSKARVDALTFACMQGKADIVKVLIQGKADMSVKNADGQMLLHIAVIYGHTDAALALADMKAKLTEKNKVGQTPVELAKNRWTDLTKQVGALRTQGQENPELSQQAVTYKEMIPVLEERHIQTVTGAI